MRIVIFCHSIRSDWNHGNAHFLRGIATELTMRGNEVTVFEPHTNWSSQHLAEDAGMEALEEYRQWYPALSSTLYDPKTLNLDRALDGANIVLVHEWNDPRLVWRIGRHRLHNPTYTLFFHDTHHRAISDTAAITSYDLSAYDGVLAFGETLRKRYAAIRPELRVWTWHEAADIRIFQPRSTSEGRGDLVWIGNWGDGERSEELHTFLLRPSSQLGLRTDVYGVRYPSEARRALGEHGLRYRGWLPNYRAPEVFAKFSCTIHIPRRPYVEQLLGIPTIRVFEALACGIPLISAPWKDTEGLFTAGRDYLVARSGEEATDFLRCLCNHSRCRQDLIDHGLRTIREHHTCGHRVDQLMEIAEQC